MTDRIAITIDQGVADVCSDAVLRIDDGGNPTLCPVRGRRLQTAFAEHGDAGVIGKMQGSG